MPPTDTPPSHRGTSIAGLVLLLAFALFGVWMVWDGSRERGLAVARAVDVDAARAAVADPAPVRLRGVLVTLPAPLASPAGGEYALQAVWMTHSEPAGNGSRTETDYDRHAPEQLFLSGRDSTIAIDLDGLDQHYLPPVARGRTDGAGRLPDSVARHIVPAFRDIPRQPDAKVEVRGIPATDTVTAYGSLELRAGFPVLVRPANGDPLLLTTASFAELQQQVAATDRTNRWLGWFVIVMSLGVAFAVWWYGVREGRV